MFIIAIDPHKDKIAAAVFKGERLVSVELVKSNLIGWVNFNRGVYDRAIIERPQIYSQRTNKDPNDLIDVAMTAGMCALIATGCQYVLPRTWKGQVPKKIHQERIKSLLTPEEHIILGDRSNDTDILDAVGIGLWYLKRR